MNSGICQDSFGIFGIPVLWGNTLSSQQGQTLTNDPEDAQDVGGEDNQQVDTGEQDNGDECVPWPAELLVLK